MRAMILAAGLGTRLRPLTDTRPKALVEIAGRTLLELTLSRLRASDVHQVVINVHHFPDMIVDYLQRNNNFGMHVEISREEVLLDTGGGLKNAAAFFLKDPRDLETPFILHNVDVVSTIDLRRMIVFHTRNQALATLAVQDRRTSRYLLFDERAQLCGRRFTRDRRDHKDQNNEKDEFVRSSPHAQALAFSGVHVISPRLLTMMSEEGIFSILTPYLRLAAQGEKILAFRADEYYWRDLGKPQDLKQAAEDLARGVFR